MYNIQYGARNCETRVLRLLGLLELVQLVRTITSFFFFQIISVVDPTLPTYIVRHVGDVNTTFESRGSSTTYFVRILDGFAPVRVF